MNLHGGARYLHIGCDEVYHLGTCAPCLDQSRWKELSHFQNLHLNHYLKPNCKNKVCNLFKWILYSVYSEQFDSFQNRLPIFSGPINSIQGLVVPANQGTENGGGLGVKEYGLSNLLTNIIYKKWTYLPSWANLPLFIFREHRTKPIYRVSI